MYSLCVPHMYIALYINSIFIAFYTYVQSSYLCTYTNTVQLSELAALAKDLEKSNDQLNTECGQLRDKLHLLEQQRARDTAALSRLSQLRHTLSKGTHTYNNVTSYKSFASHTKLPKWLLKMFLLFIFSYCVQCLLALALLIPACPTSSKQLSL